MKKLYKIKKSNIDKKGLYASTNIKEGIKIIEYKGKIISVKETEINPKFDNDKAIYLFNLNKRYDLDGDFKYNTARLINHSCDPNCEVDGVGLKLWVYSIKDIKKGAKLLTGTHDFSTYRSSSCTAKSPIRTIKKISIKKNRNGKILLRFVSKSFLQKQVRSMVGCLKFLGEGKWNISKFKISLNSKKRSTCAPPAPACGLYLEKVKY